MIAPRCGADEQTRQVQEELRKRHLFFSDIDGRNSPAVAEALRKYQQRQGFAPTGAADDVTLRSLGVVDEPAPPAEGGELPDVPVLRSDTTLGDKSAEFQNANPTPPPGLARSQTSTAARKEVRDFIRTYFDSAQMGTDAELVFYANPVEYFDHGRVDSAYVRNELAAYNQQWPTRKYTLEQNVRVSKTDGKIVARCRVKFYVSSVARSRSAVGQTEDTFILTKRPDAGFQIVSIQEERIAKRARGSRYYARNPGAAAFHSAHRLFRNILRTR